MLPGLVAHPKRQGLERLGGCLAELLDAIQRVGLAGTVGARLAVDQDRVGRLAVEREQLPELGGRGRLRLERRTS